MGQDLTFVCARVSASRTVAVCSRAAARVARLPWRNVDWHSLDCIRSCLSLVVTPLHTTFIVHTR